MTRPLHIKNALIWDHNEPVRRDLYTASGRIVERPAGGGLVIDFDGCTVFPGSINAHDHLELNHYPRTKFREVYNNAHEWGEDVNAHLSDKPFKLLRAYPLEDRCFIGGLKNLLCGATTVVHHGPPHKCLFRHDFPVRVLREYGWAHSLHFNTDAEVMRSYRSTPKHWPWFIHLAEGTDTVAAGEYQRLKALGCMGPNTVIVHGVGITDEDTEDAKHLVQGIVWCPTTNHYLLNQTMKAAAWGSKVMIGSDSRLTAAGDWLDEIRSAAEVCRIGSGALNHFSTDQEHPLRLVNTGRLTPGAWADWWVQGDIPVRSSLRLVVKGGVPQIGAPDLMAKFPHIPTVAAALDGVPKAIHIDLARRIQQCTLKEVGLKVDVLPQKRFFLI